MGVLGKHGRKDNTGAVPCTSVIGQVRQTLGAPESYRSGRVEEDFFFFFLETLF